MNTLPRHFCLCPSRVRNIFPSLHLFLALFMMLAANLNASVGALMRKGNSCFQRQKFAEALSIYQRAEVLEPDNLAIHYNLGNTLYRLGRFPDAVSELSLATVAKNNRLRANAFYNLGNTFYRLNRLDDAIQAYKMALLANPQDRQAKENLEFCLKRRQEQSQKDSTGQQESRTEQNQPQAQNQPQPRPQSPAMEKDQAERILQAVENKEKQTQQEARRPKGRRQVEQDW
jgi:Ca-activated chloride channel family protein